MGGIWDDAENTRDSRFHREIRGHHTYLSMSNATKGRFTTHQGVLRPNLNVIGVKYGVPGIPGMSLTMPSVVFPVRWSCFCTMRTRCPALISI
jgi:hypothetical protein